MVKPTFTLFATWTEARVAARIAQGPVVGWIECTHERGRYIPIACGTRCGEVTGPSVDGWTMVA